MKRRLLFHIVTAFAVSVPVLASAQVGWNHAEFLKYYLRSRVDANGSFDMAAWQRAIDHRDHMPPARFGGGSNSEIVTAKWSFVGPNNTLSAPNAMTYGPGPFSGRTTCLAADPTNSLILYAGGAEGGLWKTLDGGATWKCISDVSPWTANTVSSVAVDAKNHLIVYAGTGDFDGNNASVDQGLMKSTDGGATWTNYGTTTPGIVKEAISKIIIDPDNDQIVTICTGHGAGANAGAGGVYNSINGGQTFTPGAVITSDYSSMDVSLKNGRGVRTYWAVGAGNPGLIYTSIDQGRTWVRIRVYPPDFNNEPVLAVACSKVSYNTVYLLAPASQKIYKTIDGGASWQDSTGITFPNSNQYGNNWTNAGYDYCVGTYLNASATAGEVVFAGLDTLAYSVDGGADWTDYGLCYSPGTRIHFSQHTVTTNPAAANQVLVGNDGGVFKLTFGSWNGSIPTITQSSLNANLGTFQLNAVAPHPTDATRILTGTQGDGTSAALGNLSTWREMGFQPIGGQAAWDLGLGIFTSEEFGAVDLSYLNGTFSKQITAGFSTAGLIAPLTITSDNAFLWVASNVLNKYQIATGQWFYGTFNLTGSTGAYVNAIAQDPTNDEKLYTGSTDGFIYHRVAPGSFVRLDQSPLPAVTPVGAIAISPVNPNAILVGFQTTGVRHLFFCPDTTALVIQWSDVGGSGSTGLPDSPVNAIAMDPYQSDSIWYVGTGVGAFMTTDAGKTWKNMSAMGLPNVEITDLKVGGAPGTTAQFLYAATFGRGIWRIQAALPTQISSVTLNPSTLLGGASSTGTVHFTNAPGANGAIFYVSSSDPSTTVPSGPQTLPFNATSANFPISTTPVGVNMNVTITATFFTSAKTAVLAVKAATLINFVVGPTNAVVGGLKEVGEVFINQKAVKGGYPVTLASNNTAVAQPPASVTITQGNTGAAFSITTFQVAANTLVTITATGINGVKTASFTVQTPAVASITVNPTTVVGGHLDTVTVTLAVPAPPSGVTVAISSDNNVVVPVPSSVFIKAGNISYPFYVVSSGVAANTIVNLSATGPNGTTKSAALTVNAANLVSVTSNTTTVKGGTPVTAYVNLDGAASPNGAVVSLMSNSSYASVPTTITVGPGKSSQAFTITTYLVTTNTAVTITATYRGVSKTLNLTITP